MHEKIEVQVGELLRQHQFKLATAESCTGGLIGHLITNVPGSSDYYLGGAQVYSNQIKHRLLGVRMETLEKFGAVSEETVVEMACGVREILDADIGLAVSGIAGPGGGSVDKPVGLVWIGLAAPEFKGAWENHWGGSRVQIKESAAYHALDLLYSFLQEHKTLERANERDKDSSSSRKPVEVWVDIDQNGNMLPTDFSLGGVKYRIDSIGRQWIRSNRRHFLVMVPIDKVYELIFDPQEGRWFLRIPNLPGQTI